MERNEKYRFIVGGNTGPYIANGPIKSHLPSTLDKSIPDAMKACTTGWKPQSLGKRKYEVYKEREYDEKHMGGLLDSYIFVAESTERHLRELGLDNNPANTVANLISDEVFAYIAHHTTQQLVKRNLPAVDVYEFKRFYATKLLRSRFNVSSDQAWKEVMEPLATRHGFSLMDMNRFNNILTSIRGYDVTSGTGDCRDDAWLQRKNLLRNLNELEQKVFKRSMDWLFNRESGSLVVDDWLVSSRAKDVEAKTYSDRKAGRMSALLIA